MNNRWRAVRLFYNWCYEKGIIKENPCGFIKTPKPDKRIIPTFKEHHIRTLLYLCPPNRWWGARDRAIILTLLLTGIRLEELAGLTLSSLNFKEMWMRVRGKGNKERKVYIEKRLLDALINWLIWREKILSEKGKEKDALWITQEGDPLTKEGVSSIIKRLAEKSGIKDVRVSAHTFRHTFAVNMLRAGKDIRFLQAVLGHESLSSTEIYVRTLSQEDAIEWHKKVEPFKGWKL